MTDLGDVRGDFPLLGRTFEGRPLVYLDSAATTQKPHRVIETIDRYYRELNANVHRGAYRLSAAATDAYEEARAKVARFIGAGSPEEVVFTRGATTALNHVAYGWGLHRLGSGDRILLTVMEHHSNIVPWQMVARLTGAELVYLDVDDEYRVDLSNLDELLDERVKIVSVSGMSNVTGALGPVAELAEAVADTEAVLVVDGAQLVPHAPVDVAALGADFLAFSGHKMLGPTGIGVLWGRPERLADLEPTEGGGEMIVDVTLTDAKWAPVPHRFEAGTPPIAQAIGLGAAVDYLEDLGMDAVRAHEEAITAYALDRLSEIPDLTVYGPRDVATRGGAVSFELGDIHAHDLATILDEHGVAVRAGHHCAKPLMRRLGAVATTRASFYVYNVAEDVDRLVEALWKAREVFGLD
ncbi:MAG TPA: cysteine desulfurase [Actinobacteria bacterium]|nr:cysteine desulfurase [Actinomycetota bacterium]